MRFGLVVALVCGVFWVVVVGAYGSSGRGFERVSPVYKGGFGATFIEAVAQDGDSLAFFSPGEFEGAPAGLSNTVNGLDYISRREATGWKSLPIMPPDTLTPFVDDHDISPTLSSTLVLAKPGPSVEAADLEGSENEFLLHDNSTSDVSSNWTVNGSALKTLTDMSLILLYEGASLGFCHMLFLNSEDGSEEKYQLVKQAAGAERPLYEVDGCSGEATEPRLVAVDSTGKPISRVCGSEAGVFRYRPEQADRSNAISADGSEVFFTTCVKNEPGDHQLFLRLGGEKTLEVSKPIDPGLEVCGEQQIPCPDASGRASANFEGASQDGSKVFFSTTAPLVSGDKDMGSDLYMAEIGCPSAAPGCSAAGRRVTGLTQVTHDPNGGEGGLRGVVRVARDGSRVYFVAGGDLLTPSEDAALESEGRVAPSVGADNLYVYDADSRQVSFVADLCSGYEMSGGAEDSDCPSHTGTDTGIWREAEREAQTAGPDGRFLVFASYGRLTADDTDTAKDIYRYDAETGVLERVSLGEEGSSDDGNGPVDANIVRSQLGADSVQDRYELSTRAVSESGARIVFRSAQALAPAAANGLTDVYEWHEAPDGVGGEVSLVSGGGAEYPIEDAAISPEGSDVFFATTQGLVSEDTDGEADIYDARIGGGFPEPPAAHEPCSSEACQGPLTNPAPLLVPGSATQTPGENLAPPTPVKKTKSVKKKSTKTKKKKKSVKGKTSRRRRARATVHLHIRASGGARSS
jgi:hypothetical protein